MERHIGEIFYYNDVKIEVIKINRDCCTGCYFYNKVRHTCNRNIENNIGSCISYLRKDLKNVIFKEIK